MGKSRTKRTGVGVRKGYIGLRAKASPIVFRNIKPNASPLNSVAVP